MTMIDNDLIDFSTEFRCVDELSEDIKDNLNITYQYKVMLSKENRG